jgi:hypothetical protein
VRKIPKSHADRPWSPQGIATWPLHKSETPRAASRCSGAQAVVETWPCPCLQESLNALQGRFHVFKHADAEGFDSGLRPLDARKIRRVQHLHEDVARSVKRGTHDTMHDRGSVGVKCNTGDHGLRGCRGSPDGTLSDDSTNAWYMVPRTRKISVNGGRQG